MKRSLLSLIIGLAVVAVTPLPSPAETRIASWNIRNLGWDNGKDFLAVAAIAAEFDFLSIQEVMSQDGIDHLEAALETRTGVAWEQMCSHLIGRGSYREMYCFTWREDRISWIDGAAV